MEVVWARCAGLDIHRTVIVACALVTEAKGKVRKEVSEFPTTVAGLQKLVAWLQELQVVAVGMESTGVYWMPVYAALEAAGGLELIVANALHVKAVPGRKTDVKDAEWLARLVRHGLVRKSFVPAQPFRDLRDLTRYRRTLIEAQTSERNRLIKLLEMVDIKLTGVVSDVFGVSGRAMLRGLIEGGQSAEQMAKLARGRLRRKQPQLIEALAGTLRDHHRRMLAIQLARVEAAEADIAALDQQIAERLLPYAEQMKLLIGIPGIDWVVAAIVIAEIGVDMAAFPSAGHLAAWAGVCPGNNESAGKRKPTGARKGNPYLKTALCNAAIGASRKTGSFFKTKYHKLKSRRGGGKAALAIAHKLLVCIYHILSTGSLYRDLGADFLDKRDTQRTANRYVRKLQDLGFAVQITSAPETLSP
jgi:transposase